MIDVRARSYRAKASGPLPGAGRRGEFTTRRAPTFGLWDFAVPAISNMDYIINGIMRAENWGSLGGVARQLGRQVYGLEVHRPGLADWLRTYWAVLAAVAALALVVVLLIVITIMSSTSVS
jgi:hypothetical protein